MFKTCEKYAVFINNKKYLCTYKKMFMWKKKYKFT